MEQPLITVIVPVYKVEAYLNRCVTSIINQTYKNLEIILVDDGSPDNCGQMCDDLAKADPRIRVIHKENGGLSSARNAGLDAMSGKYVGFVDSDDWIEPDMYESLFSLLHKHEAQIAACGIQCDHADGACYYFNADYPRYKDIEVYSKIQALKELIIAHKITPSACDKLFLAEIFAQLRFKEGIVNEDFDLMPKCFESVSTAVYLPIPKYHYIMTDDSITRGTFKKSRFTEAQISRNNMLHYQQHYPSLYPYTLAKHVEICMNLVQASAAADAFPEERKALITEVRALKKKDFFRLLDKKNQVKFLLFSLSVPLFVRIMTRYYNR